MTIKCSVSRYTPNQTEPPYTTDVIDSVEIEETDSVNDPRGEIRYDRLYTACYHKGYRLKFYTMSSNPDFKYDIIIRN